MSYELIELESGFAVKGFVVGENQEIVQIMDSAQNVWNIPKNEIVSRGEVPFSKPKES